MCGITGYWSRSAQAGAWQADLDASVRSLRQRGPDDQGIFLAPGVGLVHPESGSLTAFGAGAQSVLRHTGHRIDHHIAQLQEPLLLRAGEGIEPTLFSLHVIADDRVGLAAVLPIFARFPRGARL